MIIIGMFLVLYLTEVCGSTSCRYVFSRTNNAGCDSYIETMKHKQIEMWSRIDCYHTVRYEAGSMGGTHDRVHDVFTHSEHMLF